MGRLARPVRPGQRRGFIGRNSIALLSGLAAGLDQPSPDWLGRNATSRKVRQSGLWDSDRDCPLWLARSGMLRARRF